MKNANYAAALFYAALVMSAPPPTSLTHAPLVSSQVDITSNGPAKKKRIIEPATHLDIFPRDVWFLIQDALETPREKRLLENSIRLSPETFPNAISNTAFELVLGNDAKSRDTLRKQISEGIFTKNDEKMLSLQGLFYPPTRRPVVFAQFRGCDGFVSSSIRTKLKWSTLERFECEEFVHGGKFLDYPWRKMTSLQILNIQDYRFTDELVLHLPPTLQTLYTTSADQKVPALIKKACRSGVRILDVLFEDSGPLFDAGKDCAENTALRSLILHEMGHIDVEGNSPGLLSGYISNLQADSNLEKLVVDVAFLPPVPTFTSPIFLKLKHFKLASPFNAAHVVQILKWMPNLDSLELDFFRGTGNEILVARHIANDMPFLKALTLDPCDHFAASQTFVQAYLSSIPVDNVLSELSLRMHNHDPDAAMMDFSGLKRLKQLTSIEVEYAEIDALYALKDLPLLTRVIIDFSANAAANFLNVYEAVMQLPKLKHLELRRLSPKILEIAVHQFLMGPPRFETILFSFDTDEVAVNDELEQDLIRGYTGITQWYNCELSFVHGDSNYAELYCLK